MAELATAGDAADPRRRCRQINLSRAKRGLRTTEQSRCCNRDLPVVGGFGSEDPKRRSRDKMALEIEGIVDDGMHAEEPLGGSSRFEPPHLTLSPPHHLMRVFGAVVFPQPLLVWAGQSQTPERGGVRAQLVGDQQFGREALRAACASTAAPPGCHGVAEPACRGSRPRDRQHATGTSACRRSPPHLVEMPTIARPRTAPA